MNVIISNKNKEMLDRLNIEVIKRLDGEYSVDEIVNTFQNFFFNKMILDITSIRDYTNLSVIQKFASSFDLNKVIFLLDASVSSPDYVSKIISMGIYNFTSNLEGIMYLFYNPNTYSDVSQYHQIDNMIVEESNEPAPNVFEFSGNESSSSNSDVDSSNVVQTNREIGVDNSLNVQDVSKGKGTRIIGIKSVTPGAGSTTLTYLMKKQLEKKYKVLAIEVEKRDFIYFNDKDLVSSANGVIGDLLTTNKDKDVLLVDLNGSQAAENFCDEVLYLIEPSIIKINRLLSIKPKILNELKGKKVVLCPSLLSNKDVKDFEYESGLSIFYNMVPVDDHSNSNVIKDFLTKLQFK